MASPQQAMDRVNHEFAGQDVGNFFISYGSAASSKPLSGGGKLYRWVSLEPGGGSSSPAIFAYPGGTYSIPQDNANGEMMSGYCEISITTDAHDRIRKLTLVSDSIGKFSGSRCAEIFSQPPPD
jgi:hypothetical protein